MNRDFPGKCLLLMTGAFHTPGGIAAVNRLTIRAMTDCGYSVDALALLEDNATVDARYLGASKTMAYTVFRGSKQRFATAAWKRLLHGSYTHVIVDHVNLASAIAPLTWLRLCRYAVWLCGVEVFPPRPDRQGELGLRNAATRLAISDYTKQRVAERYPKLPIITCDLALDPVRHQIDALPGDPANPRPVVLRAASGHDEQLAAKAILHVGRMAANERYKGQDTLIRAFPLVRREHSDAQLVFAGAGDDFPRLSALASQLGPEDQRGLFFAGYVDDELLNRLYQTSFLFAMPSSGEGFGLVYLEAMSHGRVCVASKTDAARCVVREGDTGLLVDNPDSPDEVARALTWLLSHPEEARQMGQNGAALVASRYRYSNFRQRFWASLEGGA